MKSVVITGSTRGIGLGLAEGFLASGCKVTISGRRQSSVDQAMDRLERYQTSDDVIGQPCEVTDPAQHDALWQAAVAKFGRVDIWINNAGIGHPMKPVWELDAEVVDRIMDTNLLGVVHGSRTAIRGMLEHGGSVYNMEGFGSRGQVRAGLSVYGASKYALTYLTKGLTKETKDTPVKVSAISPGIVITDFILDQYVDDPEGLARAKRIFNILGDLPSTVCPWIVEKVIADPPSGSRIAWLSGPKIMGRFLTARFKPRDLFGDSGQA
jgi:NAD(P)-dependent dehydrogenase (short-subunit alcohol dehydrogenase family)